MIRINVGVNGMREPWLLMFRGDSAALRASEFSVLEDEFYSGETKRIADMGLAAVPEFNIRYDKPEIGDAVMLISDADTVKLGRLFRSGEATRMVKECRAAADCCACVIAARDRFLFSTMVQDADMDCELLRMIEDGDELLAAGDDAEKQAEFGMPVEAEKFATVAAMVNDERRARGFYRSGSGYADMFREVAGDKNVRAEELRREKQDPTLGGGRVLLPFGGVNQMTPVQAVVDRLPVQGRTDDCTIMSYGRNTVEAIAKAVACGAYYDDIHMTVRSGLPYTMSMGTVKNIFSQEFKSTGHKVVLLSPRKYDMRNTMTIMSTYYSMMRLWRKAHDLLMSGDAVTAYALGYGGVAEAVMKMCFGNGIGFEFCTDNGSDALGGYTNKEEYDEVSFEEIFGCSYGSMVLELAEGSDVEAGDYDVKVLGWTDAGRKIVHGKEEIGLKELAEIYQAAKSNNGWAANCGDATYKAKIWPTPVFRSDEPKMLIPVFPGAVGEFDIARAISVAGGKAEIMIMKADSGDEFADMLSTCHMLAIPDGTTEGAYRKSLIEFLRSDKIRPAVEEFLEKMKGLVYGVGEGCAALLELGLLPFGEYRDAADLGVVYDGSCERTYVAQLRVASNMSPWLRFAQVGNIYATPAAAAHGRFYGSEALIKGLSIGGQIATQIVLNEESKSGNGSGNGVGAMSNMYRINPTSPDEQIYAVDGITSPDGKIIGKITHSERTAEGLYQNVQGNYQIRMFESAVNFFK